MLYCYHVWVSVAYCYVALDLGTLFALLGALLVHAYSEFVLSVVLGSKGGFSCGSGGPGHTCRGVMVLTTLPASIFLFTL